MTVPRPSAVLLDRDGTLNVKACEGQYITDPAQLSLLAGAGAAVARLNAAGIPVVVVTNQRGIARGLMSEADLTAVHARLTSLLAEHAAELQDILHCPHETGVCRCRKPQPGLLHEAARTLGLADLAGAVMIGDAESDVEAGRAAGARTIRLGEEDARTSADARLASLLNAVDWLLG